MFGVWGRGCLDSVLCLRSMSMMEDDIEGLRLGALGLRT